MPALQVRELTPWFGAEVSGLAPNEPVDDATCRELQQLFKDREVLLFRDFAIDRRFQNYLCELLRSDGQPDPEVVEANAARQSNFYISNKIETAAAPFGELSFHADAMWSSGPYDVLSLWAEHVVPPVTPTRFTSVTHAWDTLPDDLRARVEGLSVEHTSEVQLRGENEGRLLQAARDVRTTITKIGHPNPRSGRTMLYVCSMMTSHVIGLPPDESEALLTELFAHIEAPARTWQHEWQNGDFVVWDNLAIQHARGDVIADGPARTLRKAASPAVPADVMGPQTYATMR
jgi:alpha-ketoglutarate-dependent taurine dioxygenase